MQHAHQIIQVKKCFATKKFGPWTVLRVSKNKNTVWTVNDFLATNDMPSMPHSAKYLHMAQGVVAGTTRNRGKIIGATSVMVGRICPLTWLE